MKKNDMFYSVMRFLMLKNICESGLRYSSQRTLKILILNDKQVM